MNNNILCHIAGLNNLTKQELILNITKYHDVIEVIDFDMITKIIYKSAQFKNYEKKKQHQLMVKYWEKEFDDILMHNLSESKKNNKKVICIGNNVYARSRYVHIHINTQHIMFLNTPNAEYVKQIVMHNISSHSHDIINGTFPLKFIQHDFLSSQRDILKNIHIRLKYKLCEMDDIIKNIKQIILYEEHSNNSHINNNSNKNDDGANNDSHTENHNYDYNYLYFTSSIKYNTRFINNINSDMASIFTDTQNTIVAYKQIWMALLCSVLNDGTKMSKELINIKTNGNDIIIQELKPNSLNKLQQHIYLYKVSLNGFKNEDLQPYKYKNTSTVEILENIYVSDISDKLSNIHGIILERVKK